MSLLELLIAAKNINNVVAEPKFQIHGSKVFGSKFPTIQQINITILETANSWCACNAACRAPARDGQQLMRW